MVSLASSELLELTGMVAFLLIMSVVDDSEDVAWDTLATEEELATRVVMASLTDTGTIGERGGAPMGLSYVNIVEGVLLSASRIDVGLS